MKKLLTLMLALVMALSCAVASAETVYTQLAIDDDVAGELMTMFGVPEDQQGSITPIISLLSALGVKVTTVGAEGQGDIDCIGKTALSVGYAKDDAGISVASTLFPNYVVTVTNETVDAMMAQFMANMPGAGEGGEGGMMDMGAMQEVLGGHFANYMAKVSAAGQPGEAESGSYEYEGYTFDTYVPVTIDTTVITEATQELLDGLLADPAAMAMIKGMATGISQSTGQTFNEETFEEDFKKGFEEWANHIPKDMVVDWYGTGESGMPFYMCANPQIEDSDMEMAFDMLMVDEQTMKMGYSMGNEEMTMTGSFEMAGTDMSMSFDMGGMFMGLNMSFPEGKMLFDVFFMNAEKPLVSVAVTMSEDGEITLPATADGKTVLAVEDAMNDESDEATQGLLGDVMSNGLMGLISVVTEAVPEASALLGMLMGGGMGMAS